MAHRFATRAGLICGTVLAIGGLGCGDGDGSGGLESLEETIKLTTVYRWLALKFPAAFTDLAHVEQVRREATEQTQAILRRNWG